MPATIHKENAMKTSFQILSLNLLLILSANSSAADACVTPPAGLAGWWPGDGDAYDRAGTNFGMLQSGATYAAGYVGQAFSVNGGVDGVTLPANALNRAYTSMTVEAWVYPTQHGHQPAGLYGFTVFSTTESDGFALRVLDGYLQPDLRLTGGTVRLAFTQAMLPLNAWSHVAMTYDGSQVRAYLNGQLLGSQAASGTVKNSVNNGVITTIGNEGNPSGIETSDYGWRGRIDELAVFDRALFSNEIAAIYAAGTNGMCRPGSLLAEAVDAPALAWVTGGDAVWFAQTTNTHDDVDAAQSGRITNNQTSWLETTVMGPGVLSFWWKVSSETNYDWLSFALGSSVQARISGEVDWRPLAVAIAAGPQTIRWTYSKDVSLNRGMDAAWVDQMQFDTNLTSLPVPPESNLVAYYPFNGNARDESGHDNHGTVYNALLAADRNGLSNTAYQLDGSGDYIDCGSGASLNHLTNFTLAAWIRPGSVSGQPIFSKHTTEGSRNCWSEFVLQLFSDGTLMAFLGDGGDGGNCDFPETLVYNGVLGKLTSPDQWYHAAMVVTDTQARIYLNGRWLPPVTGSLDTIVPSHRQYGTRPFQIGRYNNGGIGYFKGRTDEVRVYNTALSGAEIVSVMEADRMPPRITRQPVAVSTNVGATVQLSVAAFGATPLRCQWLKNGLPLPASTNLALLIVNAQAADFGSYRAEVSNNYGSALSDEVQVTMAGVLPAHPPDWLWGRQSQSLNDWTEPIAVTTDAAGNAYVTGTYQGVADFGTNRLIARAWSDMFVAKYGPAGAPLWAHQGDATYTAYTNIIMNRGFGVIVDAQTNTYVAGSFAGTNFPFGVDAIVSAGNADMFLVKYDYTGMLERGTWSRRAGGPDWESAQALAIDHDGNLYVTGQFVSPTADFGTHFVTNHGGTDIFVAKYDPNGTCLWAKAAGGADHDMGYALAVDEVGNVYVTGYFEGTAFFDARQITAAGGRDVFLARYDAVGHCDWVRSAGGTAHESANALILPGGDRVCIAGYFQGAATFGATVLPSPGADKMDWFVAEWDRQGNWHWAKHAGGTNAWCHALATDAAGHLYAAGQLGGTAQFGGHPLTSSGPLDVAIAMYDASANVLWNRVGGNTNAHANGLACDPAGNLLVAGAFYGNAVFGPDVLTNATGLDVFVAKIGIEAPTVLAQPQSVTTNEGATVTFTVQAEGSAPLFLQWRKGGVPIYGATNATLLLTNVRLSDAGLYRVSVSNPWGARESATAQLTVVPAPIPPSLLTQPQPVTTNAGATVMFTVTASGAAPLFYSWSRDGAVLFGATGPTLTLANVQTNQSGGYSVIVTNAFGAVTSVVAQLTVLPVAPPQSLRITRQPQSVTTNSGATVVLDVQASGAGPFSYRWRKGGQPLAGATNATLVLADVTPSDDGVYSVEVSNAHGSAISSGARLTVLIDPSSFPKDWLWARSVGSPDPYSLNEWGGCIGLDAQTNCYVWIETTGSNIVVGNSVFTNRTFLIVKYRRDGTPLQCVASGQDIRFRAGTVDAAGNVYIAGVFSTEVLGFGGTILQNRSPGQSDVVLASFDSNGNNRWATSIGSAGADEVSALALDSTGHVLITGSAPRTNVLFGANPVNSRDGRNTQNIFIARYTGLGEFRWAQLVGGNNVIWPVGLAFDAEDNVFVAGRFFFDKLIIGSVTNVSRGGGDTFLLSYTKDAILRWATSAGGSNRDDPIALAVDREGNVVLTGWFYSSRFYVGPTNQSLTLTNSATLAYAEVFLASFSNLGQARWAESFRGTATDEPTALALDAANNVFVAGWYQSTNLTIGGVTFGQLGGGDEVFVASFDSAGASRWWWPAGGAGQDRPHALAVDPSGHVVLAGHYRSSNFVIQASVLRADRSIRRNGDLFLASFGNGGEWDWVNSATVDGFLNIGWPGEYGLFPISQRINLVADAAGNLFVTGNFNDNPALFGTNRLPVSLSYGDFFLAKYGPMSADMVGPSITQQPQSVATNAGASVTLRVEATGTQPLHYRWFKNGLEVTNATNATLLLASVQPSDAGRYQVEVRNLPGSVLSSEAVVQVLVSGIANVRASQRPGTNLVDITYDLGGAASQLVTISASADGGATWAVAVTTVAGDVGFAVAPGVNHRVVWSVGTDWPEQQTSNMVVRVSITGSQAQSAPFAVNTVRAAVWRLRVWADRNANDVFDAGEALPAAEVYYGGRTSTNRVPGSPDSSGEIVIQTPATAGQTLFARYQVTNALASRPYHQAVDNAVFTLWLDSDLGGPEQSDWNGNWISRSLSASEVAAAQADGVVDVRLTHPVFEWHLVVATEPADETFIRQFYTGLANASAYLWDVTDGQMKFGKVAIYPGASTNSALWDNADLIVFAQNGYRANAKVGGMIWDPGPGKQMRFGTTRTFLNSPMRFSPDQPIYFAGFVHEFGHYAFGFRDEYTDGNGDAARWTAYRTNHLSEIPRNYGVMDADYLFDELSSFNDYLPSYRLPLNPAIVTMQWFWTWQMFSEPMSCWYNLRSMWQDIYAGIPVSIVAPPFGSFVNGASTSNDRPGPTTIPAPYRYLRVSIEAAPTSPGSRVLKDHLTSVALDQPLVPPTDLVVTNVRGPVAGATVIVKKDQGQRLERLGQTGLDGHLLAYGLSAGDEIELTKQSQAVSHVVTGEEMAGPIRLTLPTFSSARTQPKDSSSALAILARAHLRDVPTRTILLEILASQPLTTAPSVSVRLDDGPAQPVAMTISNATFYSGEFSVNSARRGTIQIQCQSTAGQTLNSSDTFSLGEVAATGDQVYSRDGHIELSFLPGGLTSNSVGLVHQSFAPPIIPAGFNKVPVGEIVSLDIAHGAAFTGSNAVVNLYYPDTDILGVDERSLRLYRWDPSSQGWILAPSVVGLELNVVSASISQFGVYALFADASNDITPPATVTDLVATTSSGDSSVELSWTAPGDDGHQGAVTAYILKASTNEITEANWDALPPLPLHFQPGIAGAIEHVSLRMTDPGLMYYFGLKAADEVQNLSPLSNITGARSYQTDSDDDGLSDQWEITYGLNPYDPSDAAVDPDGDGLSNLEECRHGTAPSSWDTDGDGMSDGWEVTHGLNPLSVTDRDADPDHDTLTNILEYQVGTDPNNPDTDGDGLPDGWEVANGMSPICAFGLNGAAEDCDGDHFSNFAEMVAGTDPRNAASGLQVSVEPVVANGQLTQVRVVWASVASRLYQVEWSSSLQGSFAPTATNLLATPPLNVFTDWPGTNVTTRFYRVRVQ